LTSHQETDITTIIQRRRQHPRHAGRNRSEQVVAIVGMPTARNKKPETTQEQAAPFLVFFRVDDPAGLEPAIRPFKPACSAAKRFLHFYS
jgi:hypothetical protein